MRIIIIWIPDNLLLQASIDSCSQFIQIFQMFRSNFDSSKYVGRNPDRKPMTPISDRKLDSFGQQCINLNGTKNQFFEGSKSKDTNRFRNSSDYQLNLNAGKPGNQPNKQNLGHQTVNSNQLNPNQNSAALSLQLLNDKINYLANRLNRNQESVKNLNLRPLSSFDDKFSRTTDSHSGSFRDREGKDLEKGFQEMRGELGKHKERTELALNNLSQSIRDIKKQIQNQVKQPSTDWELQIKSLSFEIKDTCDGIKLELAKSYRQQVNKFVDITKEQLSIFRSEINSKVKSNLEQSLKLIESQKSLKTNANSEHCYTTGNRLFGGRAISFAVQESIHIISAPARQNLQHNLKNTQASDLEASTKISETLYFLDCEGYLLDEKNRYLLDDQNVQVKLNKRAISTLKELKILK